jgi:hypothetical protein
MHPAIELLLVLLLIAFLARRAKSLAPRLGLTEGVIAVGLAVATR